MINPADGTTDFGNYMFSDVQVYMGPISFEESWIQQCYLLKVCIQFIEHTHYICICTRSSLQCIGSQEAFPGGCRHYADATLQEGSQNACADKRNKCVINHSETTNYSWPCTVCTLLMDGDTFRLMLLAIGE